MPFCRKCGEKLDSDASFCIQCGTQLVTTSTTKCIKREPALLLDEIPIKGWLELWPQTLRFISESSNTTRQVALSQILESASFHAKPTSTKMGDALFLGGLIGGLYVSIQDNAIGFSYTNENGAKQHLKFALDGAKRWIEDIQDAKVALHRFARKDAVENQLYQEKPK